MEITVGRYTYKIEAKDWKNHGKDRTYFNDVSDGDTYGYRDNETGEFVPGRKNPSLCESIMLAIEEIYEV